MSDLLKSLIRTFVPLVVGLIASTAAQVGIELPGEALSGVVDALFVGFYYLAVRRLEDRYPVAGWLLGLPSTPHYDQGPA